MSELLGQAKERADWMMARCGCATASHAADIIKRGAKGNRLQAWYSYLDQVLAERLTGEPTWTPTTPAMQWGIDHEAEAAAAYEALTGAMLSGTGKEFIRHPTIEWLGASPDRFVGDDGLVEIKCPGSVTHITRLRTREIPEQYRWQMNVQLLCTGRKWCDFVDYDPRLSGEHAHLRILVLRHEPSADELAATEAACRDFLGAVDAQIQALAELATGETESK